MKSMDLKNLILNDRLGIEDARKWYEAMLKEKILSMYTFPKNPSSDGFYHIGLKDPERPGKRRQIKAKTLEQLKDKVYEIANEQLNIGRKTFKDVFELVEENRIKYVKNPEKLLSVKNSITVHKCTYRKYFSETDFEKMFIDDISKEDIENICYSSLVKYNMCKKSFLAMRGVLKSVFTFAYEQYWINDNTYNRINFRKFDDMLIGTTQISERMHSLEEIDKMMNYIHSYQESKPAYIAPYALELQMLMGLRRGEIAPLMWSDIDEDSILISKEQISVRKSEENPKEYCTIVNHTKTYVNREFPLTSEIREFLSRLKTVDERYYPESQYLFPEPKNETGVINNNVVYHFYSRMCKKLGIKICREAVKGPHSFRRNGITKVSNSPNGGILIASVLYGNSVQSASKHYYGGVNMAQAREILET